MPARTGWLTLRVLQLGYKLAILTHGTSNVQLIEAECGQQRVQLLRRSLNGFPNRFQRNKKARHRRPTAHARARYRCFLPDLAGLARMRRAGPIPDQFDFSIARDQASGTIVIRIRASSSGMP